MTGAPATYGPTEVTDLSIVRSYDCTRPKSTRGLLVRPSAFVITLPLATTPASIRNGDEEMMPAPVPAPLSSRSVASGVAPFTGSVDERNPEGAVMRVM